jgi:hypothetical protein
MIYIAMFDFGLAALGIAALGFFVWCWIAFGRDRTQHPIYRGLAVASVHNRATTRVRSRCA